MTATIRPSAEPARELDLTECLVAAIEREIAERFGGNPVLNRLEAEGHLARLLGEQPSASSSPSTNQGKPSAAAIS